MTKSIVKPSASAATNAPYSPGVRIGDLLFCAGQVPVIPETGQLLADDIRAQTQRTLENLNLILQDQGLTAENVVKTTVFMTNLADFALMNETYGKFFTKNHPARTTVQVAALPRGAQVEIEAIAHY
ncbi:MAG TPA: Rid family detoxifying hydrolase [Verrucomicrobiae bacterium]|nr:Rid family detoxifying hydrolase [Verrucomicrobiae bacterium]